MTQPISWKWPAHAASSMPAKTIVPPPISIRDVIASWVKLNRFRSPPASNAACCHVGSVALWHESQVVGKPAAMWLGLVVFW